MWVLGEMPVHKIPFENVAIDIVGVRQIRTTTYHPQSNGSVERMHGTLVPMLYKLVSKDLPWDNQVEFVLHVIRATPNKSTGLPHSRLSMGEFSGRL